MKIKIFCDIVGTFTGGIDRNDSLISFSHNIKNLNLEGEVSFSFITSDGYDCITESINELKKHIDFNDKIKLGIQYYSCNNNLVNSKIDQIIKEIKNNKYEVVYYFDDSTINIELFNILLPKHCLNTEFIGIVINNGIDDLNKELENQIEKSYKKKLKKRI